MTLVVLRLAAAARPTEARAATAHVRASKNCLRLLSPLSALFLAARRQNSHTTMARLCSSPPERGPCRCVHSFRPHCTCRPGRPKDRKRASSRLRQRSGNASSGQHREHRRQQRGLDLAAAGRGAGRRGRGRGRGQDAGVNGQTLGQVRAGQMMLDTPLPLSALQHSLLEL